jgi:hypothetical protein
MIGGGGAVVNLLQGELAILRFEGGREKPSFRIKAAVGDAHCT